MGVLEFQQAGLGSAVRYYNTGAVGLIVCFGYIRDKQVTEVDCVDKANGAYVKFPHVEKPQFVGYAWLSFDA